MTSPIRLLIVDDDSTVRRALRMRLALASDIDVVGEAATGRAAIEQVTLLNADVVLLDIKMPGMDGVEVCMALRSSCASVVILSIDDGQTARARCAAAGAAGFVSKQNSTADLLLAIRTARRLP